MISRFLSWTVLSLSFTIYPCLQYDDYGNFAYFSTISVTSTVMNGFIYHWTQVAINKECFLGPIGVCQIIWPWFCQRNWLAYEHSILYYVNFRMDGSFHNVCATQMAANLHVRMYIDIYMLFIESVSLDICVFYNFATPRWRMYLNVFLVKDKCPLLLTWLCFNPGMHK